MEGGRGRGSVELGRGGKRLSVTWHLTGVKGRVGGGEGAEAHSLSAVKAGHGAQQQTTPPPHLGHSCVASWNSPLASYASSTFPSRHCMVV